VHNVLSHHRPYILSINLVVAGVAVVLCPTSAIAIATATATLLEPVIEPSVEARFVGGILPQRMTILNAVILISDHARYVVFGTTSPSGVC